MPRLAFLPLASLAVVALPASAQPQSMYRVGLATPLTATLVLKDLRWSCVGDSCSAIRAGTSPDANICSAFARRYGPVTSFSAGDRVFDAALLEKCNASAKRG